MKRPSAKDLAKEAVCQTRVAHHGCTMSPGFRWVGMLDVMREVERIIVKDRRRRRK